MPYVAAHKPHNRFLTEQLEKWQVQVIWKQGSPKQENKGVVLKKELQEIVEMIDRDHRTQQQVMFTLFMEVIRMWGKRFIERRYDDRNKATCKYSCDIRNIAEQEDWFIPFI